MNELKEYIDLQIEFNQSKNLFYKEIQNSMKFKKLIFNVIPYLVEISPNNLNTLVGYTTEKVLQEFCRVNQYFSFKENDIIELNKIYQNLYYNLIDKKQHINSISQTHYENLKFWMEKTNPFSREAYRENEPVIESVVCSEYSAFLQKSILQLNNVQLLEPILDIGCGKAGNLVRDLRKNGFEAYGIDRFTSDLLYTEKADWLIFDYGIKKWGTIISNLGFSNHFIYNHLRKNGNYIEYANKYMNILRSLKNGGSFHYAPDLPFIEKHLDERDFSINKYNNDNLSFKTSIIKRLKL